MWHECVHSDCVIHFERKVELVKVGVAAVEPRDRAITGVNVGEGKRLEK